MRIAVCQHTFRFRQSVQREMSAPRAAGDASAGVCRMTHMRPHFERISAHLYRYHERALPPPTLPPRLLVLFVPGNGGDHAQIRSIAAETLRADGEAVGFYAVNLGTGYSALDGHTLRRHATRVVAAVRALAAEHQPQLPLVLLAHSMGGVAALEAVRLMDEADAPSNPPRGQGTKSPHVNTANAAEPPDVVGLISLGAPLAKPPVAVSTSLIRVYSQLHAHWRRRRARIALVSVCGGARDRQVPCQQKKTCHDSVTAQTPPAPHLCPLPGAVRME